MLWYNLFVPRESHGSRRYAVSTALAGDELRRLRERAAHLRMSVSAYLRALVLTAQSEPPLPPVPDPTRKTSRA